MRKQLPMWYSPLSYALPSNKLNQALHNHQQRSRADQNAADEGFRGEFLAQEHHAPSHQYHDRRSDGGRQGRVCIFNADLGQNRSERRKNRGQQRRDHPHNSAPPANFRALPSRPVYKPPCGHYISANSFCKEEPPVVLLRRMRKKRPTASNQTMWSAAPFRRPLCRRSALPQSCFSARQAASAARLSKPSPASFWAALPGGISQNTKIRLNAVNKFGRSVYNRLEPKA